MAAGGSELLATQPNGCCLMLLLHDSKHGLRVLEAHALALACVQATTMIYAAAVQYLHYPVRTPICLDSGALGLPQHSREVRLAKATS